MKLNYIKFTLNQLIISGLYIGNNHKLFRGFVKPYLLGRRGIVDIINLKFAYLELKILLSLILNLSSNRQKYFIYLSGNFNIFKNVFKDLENIYFTGKWFGGLFTNFKNIFSKLSNNNKSTFNTNISKLKFLPGLVILFNPMDNSIVLQESSLLSLPVAGIVDTSVSTQNLLNYIIVANSVSLNSIFLFLSLFNNAYIGGKNREKLEILGLI